MQLTLNVYDPASGMIAKQYKCEQYDIMFGTVEDLIDVIDVDKINDNTELTKLILLAMKKLKPLLKDVFRGVTDEELQNTKIKELIPLFVDILNGVMTELNSLGGNSKN